MTEPAPIPWALDVLAAHGIPPLGEDEDEHRLLGELVSLGWDVSWDDDWEFGPWDDAPGIRYEVRGKVAWLPVGEVRFVVQGESLGEAALLGLALALDLQGKRE